MATSTSANSDSASATKAANQSPRHSTGGGDTVGSPRSRRATKAVSPLPWTQIVRGDSDPIAAAPSSPSNTASSLSFLSLTAVIEPAVASAAEEPMPEGSENGQNGNAGKRPVWNKPSNGPAAEVRPVMGAVSWPALSESTRAAAKPTSESLKGLSDIGSPVAESQGTGGTSYSSQKQVSNYVSPNSTPTNSIPGRQRPMKRNNASTSSNGGFPQQQPGPPAAVNEMGTNNPLPKEHAQRSGFASQSHGGNDHQRHSFRNRNGTTHPRGDGSHHHGYGGRRDQDRGNQDWNAHRNFAGRDTHMQPPSGVPRYMRPLPPPPPSSTPFIPPPHGRPFGLGFPEMPPPVVYVTPHDSMRGVTFVAPMPPHVFFSALDPQLHTNIVNQIDYYFSNENLIKDAYLRQNMDDEGWVPIKLIAGFNKVMHLTENIQLILDALQTSNVLEVQGDKVRRRNDWMRWIMPPAVQYPNVSGHQTSGKSSQDMPTVHVQGMALEEKTTINSIAGVQADVHGEARESELASGDLSNHLQFSSGRKTDQVSIQASADHSISARN